MIAGFLPPPSLPALTIRPGVTPGIDPDDNASYFKFNPDGSLLSNYEDDKQPFLIERGDVIRITYTTGSSGYINQDFSVLGVGNTTHPRNTAGNITYTAEGYDNGSGAAVKYFDTDYNFLMYDKILVSPDPSTLTNQIPNGSIFSYTVRKRQDADNIVNVYSPAPPSGSKGAETYSGKGYIIPNDLTQTQKRNVQTLITQLKAKNNFVDDDTV